MKQLELLAPAKNLACGIAAIDHGADAVYIGASRFGARAAAGNSVEDIAELCRYAHQFGARVYVTVNTIVYDDELSDTFRLISELKQAGVDALLVQDMSLVQGAREPGSQGAKTIDLGVEMHASTQTDNRTAEKVRWLHSLGFSRVVLARELSLEEIREIHEQVPDVELEVFVHGALCVSYSGQCYMSQHCLGRSANRGECAQMCRMKYDLVDSDGREIERGRYLLSLKDLCRIDALEELADAGAVSFKIEGRLKDVAYVKNVVAAYSQRLDALCAKRSNDYVRASRGRVEYFFTPNLRKTFNRGFTDYFLRCHRDEHGTLQGRQHDIVSPDTPKALGEYVGTVKSIFSKESRSQGVKESRSQGARESRRQPYIVVAGTAAFANGDGLCFFKKKFKEAKEFSEYSEFSEHSESKTELVGFRVNRAEGNKLFPLKMPEGLRPGMALYRNNDVAFERLMAGKTAERKVPVTMCLEVLGDNNGLVDGLSLTVDADFTTIQVRTHANVGEVARKSQREFIAKELSKLGNTPFKCERVDVPEDFHTFVTAGQLAELRRLAVEALLEKMKPAAPQRMAPQRVPNHSTPPSDVPRYSAPYLYNVANREARAFYQSQGVRVGAAYELQPSADAMLMQCRHCIRFSLGYCVKHGGSKPTWREPLMLRLGDGRRFRLEFDCRQCQMNILER